MATGKTLELREIDVHPQIIIDEYLFTNASTGEVYAHNRAYRRRDESLGTHVHKHELQRAQKRVDAEARRRAKRKMSSASRKGNR